MELEQGNAGEQPEETPVIDGMPSDNDLSAAFDALEQGETGETPEETSSTPPEERKQPEMKGDDELTQAEKTKLGRKVADLSRQMATKEDLAALMAEIRSLAKPQQQPEPREPEEEPDFIADIIPRQALEQFLDRHEQKKAQIAQARERQYSASYIETMTDLLSDVEDKNVASMVYKAMTADGSKFNVKYSENPHKDCAKNFHKAYTEALRAAMPPPSDQAASPFDKNKGKEPPGVTSPKPSNQGAKKTYELDEMAREYAARMGMTEDEIADALGREVPMSLRGRMSAR